MSDAKKKWVKPRIEPKTLSADDARRLFPQLTAEQRAKLAAKSKDSA